MANQGLAVSLGLLLLSLSAYFLLLDPTGTSSQNGSTDNAHARIDWVERNYGSRLWRHSHQAKAALQKQHRKLLQPGIDFVELDLASLYTLAVGDKFRFDGPLGKKLYQGQVEFVTDHANGDITLEASILGEASPTRASFTISPQRVYAELALPSGTFVLQSVGEYAWLSAKSKLANKHSPPKEAQYL